MGLFSIFKRRQAAADTAHRPGAAASMSQAAEAVRAARASARRRLIGATVLLLVGVIGFPLLFETQPRPIPVDLPIEIPARNTVAPLDVAPSRGNRLAAAAAGSSAASTPAMIASAASSPPTAAAAAPVAMPTVSPLALPMASVPSASSAASTKSPAVRTGLFATSPAPSAASSPSRPAVPSIAPAVATASARASAPAVPAPPVAAASTRPTAASVVADKPSDAHPEANRYVVQIGAFAENPKAHEARMKVEKLGLKTYTQVVETAAGKRIRVRVGPFASKAEAEKAAAKIKGDGLPAAVLFL